MGGVRPVYGTVVMLGTRDHDIGNYRGPNDSDLPCSNLKDPDPTPFKTPLLLLGRSRGRPPPGLAPTIMRFLARLMTPWSQNGQSSSRREDCITTPEAAAKNVLKEDLRSDIVGSRTVCPPTLSRKLQGQDIIQRLEHVIQDFNPEPQQLVKPAAAYSSSTPCRK